jgi:hypothetical protein
MKWDYKCNIKQYITEDCSDNAIKACCEGISKELRSKLPREWLQPQSDKCDWSLLEIVESFESVAEVVGTDEGEFILDEVNGTLAALYDWADDNRVWLGLHT